MFQRCPEQFRRRYLLGEKERPGAALVLGGGFHFAQEHNFKQKIESGVDLPADEVVQAYHHGFELAIEKNGGADEVVWDSRENADTLRAKGARLSEAYRLQVSPSMQPTEVEKRFRIGIEGVPVPLIGAIDFVGSANERIVGAMRVDGSPEMVVDYKTSGKKVEKLKPDWLLQARIYQAVKAAPVEYHVAAKTKDPQIITPVTAPELRIEVTEQAVLTTTALVQRLSRVMAQYYAEFGPDQAWPGTITHPWACGFCGFRPTCKWWQT